MGRSLDSLTGGRGAVMFRLGPYILLLSLMFGSFAFSAITSTTGADTRKCTASIQVNEDNEVLFAETWDFPGRYGTFSCFETSRSGCIVTPNSDDYRNRFRDFGSRTFKNSKEEICFLNGLGARITYDGCYSGNVAFFDGVRFNKVSCEAPASIPAYCGKSESYARQVILARHQVKCNKLGGTFEGDVFPQEANGETEYCVSGSCEACDSEWRNNLINQWKNSECCKNGKEPNPGNGTCEEAGSMDSTKIGVSYPRITAFPGCSATPAGEGENFCNLPPKSSSSGDAGKISSSSIESFSSSGSMENVKCYAEETEAKSALASEKQKCNRAGKEPHYDLDPYLCIQGSCDTKVSSSSNTDYSSSESAGGGSSSSGEEGQSSSSMTDDGDDQYNGYCPADIDLPPFSQNFDFIPKNDKLPNNVATGVYYMKGDYYYDTKGQRVAQVSIEQRFSLPYLAKEEAYLKARWNVIFNLAQIQNSCGVLRKDYGIMEDGRRKGGITCPQTIPYVEFEPKNNISLVKNKPLCSDGSPMFKVDGVKIKLTPSKLSEPTIHIVSVGFKFSDGYVVTKEDVDKLRKHELGHKKWFQCLTYPKKEISLSGCYCEKELKNLLKEKLEEFENQYQSIVDKSVKMYHDKYGHYDHPEIYECPN